MDLVRLKFLGDIALNGDYIDLYKKNVDPFIHVQNELLDSDYVIGNLECLAKGADGENLLKRPRLTTTKETLNYLQKFNLKVVSLAHNHIYDHLEDGFIGTTNFLDDNNIKYVGASRGRGAPNTQTIIKEKSISIGLLNYVFRDTNPNLPQDSKIHLSIFNIETAVKDIISLKDRVDHIILLLHWGGRVEGGLFPDFDQPMIARKLIDAGADLIIGHHSHTIQPIEIYKGKYIFYSLGNFCFSDFMFEGKKYVNPERRKNIIIPEIVFSKNDYKVNVSFWKNRDHIIVPNASYYIKMFIKNRLQIVLRIRSLWKVYFFILKKLEPIFFYLGRSDVSFYDKFGMRSLVKVILHLKK